MSSDQDVKASAPDRRAPPVGAASFDDWVATAGGELLRFARVTTWGADPTDLVQDALVAVFAKWPKLTHPDQAGAYARRVIVHSHISRWRRWGRQVTSVDPVLLDASESSSGPVGDEVLAARQLLDTLPARQRAAVHLRFFEDMTYRQVGDILGCREATARSHVHRALRQLKLQISKDEAHD